MCMYKYTYDFYRDLKVKIICLEIYCNKFYILILLGRLKGGRPKAVTFTTLADVQDLNIQSKELPSSFMNEKILIEVLKPFLTLQARQKL